MSDEPLLSVVSPVYLAEAIVPELVARLIESLEPLGTFEIVLVDDRSPDQSWRGSSTPRPPIGECVASA